MPAFEGFDVAFASTFPEYALDVKNQRFYHFNDFNRFKKRTFFTLLYQLSSILLRERPDVVITTGSAPALIALTLAKVFLRSKTIWIDSIANCETLSASGNTARHVADIWLTQWEHLSKAEGPAYWGAVL
jgi:UDP-N-acetylglucosamine:LPS N-acetylglucosamine transferase